MTVGKRNSQDIWFNQNLSANYIKKAICNFLQVVIEQSTLLPINIQ